MTPPFHMRPLGEADGTALQALCEACADYYDELTGLPPGPAESQGLFSAVPMSYDSKLLLGVFVSDALVGVADIIKGYPVANEWRIGLLMLHPAARRSGLGRAAFGHIRQQAVDAGAQRLSLGVKSTYTPSCAFWRACGFETIEHKTLPLRGGTEFDIMAREV